MVLNLAHNCEEGVLFSDTHHLNLLVTLMAENPDVVAVEVMSADKSTTVQTATDRRFLKPDGNNFIVGLGEVEGESGISVQQYNIRETGVQIFELVAPITTQRVARDREEIGFMLGDEKGDETRSEEVEIGEARLTLSSARSFRELKSIQRNIMGITAAVALAGILITIPLVRKTVKPIQDLAEGTRKIASGDLTQRIVPMTNDEVGELAESFNQMAVDLEKSHAELKGYSETLEEKVRGRTAELKTANDELAFTNAEYRKAQSQLIQAGKMAAMGEFGAGVAHELNQPLAGIKGYTQLLLSMVPEDSPLRPRLQQIDKQASRMKEITQTMWNLARRSNFEYSFISIEQPIKDSLILISEQFRQHQIDIVTDFGEDLPQVYGDANQLHQIFLNFLSNAKDAIDEEKGGAVKITAAPIADRRYVRIRFFDSGLGIPSDIADNIFDPFFTTKDPGKGTGLGLSINFSIIQQHHGFIDMYSEEGAGTIFSITLPTELLADCHMSDNGTAPKLIAPCWASGQKDLPNGHTLRKECPTCGVYMEFQTPPKSSLAVEFKKFIDECSGTPSDK